MAELVRLSDESLAIDPPLAEMKETEDPVEVMALQIERNQNIGTDPYNCTGQHCIADIGKDQ